MTKHEADEHYDDWKDSQPKRTQRTKFKDFDNQAESAAKRKKRSHRQKKDEYWPDTDE